MTDTGPIDETRFSEAVRDPVWGNIWLTPGLREITRSEPFLRLHRIRQLGPTELVYPGATHTRASHSLGVYHVAHRALGALLARGASAWVTEEGCYSFLAAALLHDLGHFPFTHSLKDLPLEDHETLTARAILTEPLASLVAGCGADPETAAAIVDKEGTLPARRKHEIAFFRKILSGVLDPDKLDYLNRDAYFCGVPYGIQDTDFILSSVIPDPERGITVDRKSLMAIESVLFSKYLMYRSVYWHPRVRIATAMMKKAIFAALSGKLLEPETLYSQDDTGIHALIDSLEYPERSLAADMRAKRFFRVVSEVSFDVASPGIRTLEDLATRAKAEARFARFLSDELSQEVRPADVLIDIPECISFESDLYIRDEGVSFNESSTVFSRDVVSRFTSSLRMVRYACHPRIAARIAEAPALAEKLAKWTPVG